jgi:hypothetical protein
MSNNLIFQYLILNNTVDKRGSIKLDSVPEPRTKVYKEMADISRRSFEKYAKEIECEYMFSDTQHFTKGEFEKSAGCLLYECLRIIYDPAFDKFDKILFADADIVANTKENIFDVSDAEVYGVLESDVLTDDQRGGYNTWDLNPEHRKWYTDKFNQHNVPIVPHLESDVRPSRFTILNTGVVVWTKEARLKARELFDDWKPWAFPKAFNPDWIEHHTSICNDQPFISGQLTKHKFDFEPISQSWNDTPTHYLDPQKWIDGKGRHPCHFLHYTGGDGKADMIKSYHEKRFPIFNEDW